MAVAALRAVDRHALVAVAQAPVAQVAVRRAMVPEVAQVERRVIEGLAVVVVQVRRLDPVVRAALQDPTHLVVRLPQVAVLQEVLALFDLVCGPIRRNVVQPAILKIKILRLQVVVNYGLHLVVKRSLA